MEKKLSKTAGKQDTFAHFFGMAPLVLISKNKQVFSFIEITAKQLQSYEILGCTSGGAATQ